MEDLWRHGRAYWTMLTRTTGMLTRTMRLLTRSMAPAAMLLIAFAMVRESSALNNGVGLTPALGWSSWNYYETDISEKTIMAVADGLVSTGEHQLSH